MKEMTETEAKAFLRKNRFGVMSLAHEGRAYGLPLFYAYDGYDLFFYSRPGEKDDFMAHTQEGCFVVLEVRSDDEWVSVEARGRVMKVESNADAGRAFNAIAENPFPPEFGVNARGEPLRSGKGGYLWMMRPDHVTGRSSRPAVRSA